MAAYPELTQRYLSSAIDGVIVLTVAFTISAALQGEPLTGLRVALVFLFVLSYEPVLTSKRCTVGQFAMGIRVRQYDDRDEKIGLAAAYVRYLLKIVLGFLSFLSIGFQKERRAIHDEAVGSIVVKASATAP
jgi:uncharacterized RDD family membrane protein YckC